MNLIRKSAAALMLALLSAGAAHAAPLAPAAIPEEVRWVIHVDLDAARAAPAWDALRARFPEQPLRELRGKLKVIEGITGLNIETQLHGLTLYGTGFDELSSCLLIYAPMDQERLVAFLKLDQEFSTIDHKGNTIVNWRDKGRDRLMYGAFFQQESGQVAIVGPSAQMVAQALDVVAGRSPGLKSGSPLVPADTRPAGVGTARPFLWIAGRNIGELPRIQKVESPFLLQMENASLAFSTTEDRLTARLLVTALNEKAAQQMAAAAEGVKAMVTLTAADERAPARAKLLASTLQALTVTADLRNVTAEWNITFDKLAALADVVRPPASRPSALP